jgi:ABC-type methionine transport system ATPase subunit
MHNACKIGSRWRFDSWSNFVIADSIAVLHGGQVVEQGSYDQLMSIEEGAFKKLVQHQTFQEMPSVAIQLES